MGRGRTHLVGVTELGRMLGNDPTTALSVLYGLGRWEGGRREGADGPAAQGLGEGGGGGGGGEQQLLLRQQAEQQHQQHQH